MSIRLAAALLVGAFGVFLIGAGFWLVGEFEQPLEIRLRAVANRHFRWLWIHSWMFVGTLLSVAAVTVFARLLRQDGGGWMASASPIVFGIGCAAFLGTLVIGLTVTPGAAAELVRTGVVPSGFVRWQRVATGLYVGHMLMSYATFALVGTAMLRGSLAPAWLGWFGVVTGCLGVVGFALLRGSPFAPPIMAHSFGLLVGIVLLIRGAAR